jgi:hypothetical protein
MRRRAARIIASAIRSGKLNGQIVQRLINSAIGSVVTLIDDVGGRSTPHAASGRSLHDVALDPILDHIIPAIANSRRGYLKSGHRLTSKAIKEASRTTP